MYSLLLVFLRSIRDSLYIIHTYICIGLWPSVNVSCSFPTWYQSSRFSSTRRNSVRFLTAGVHSGAVVSPSCGAVVSPSCPWPNLLLPVRNRAQIGNPVGPWLHHRPRSRFLSDLGRPCCRPPTPPASARSVRAAAGSDALGPIYPCGCLLRRPQPDLSDRRPDWLAPASRTPQAPPGSSFRTPTAWLMHERELAARNNKW
jgi:hypothetical protein